MKTIGDVLRERARKIQLRLIIGGVTAMIVLATVQTTTNAVGDFGMKASVYGLFATYFAAFLIFAQRVICPTCGKSALYAVPYVRNTRHWPYCAADWTKPATDQQ